MSVLSNFPRNIATGRKPNYVPNNKEEIVRIIEGRKPMHLHREEKLTAKSFGDHKGVGRTQEEKNMLKPIGEKAWPLRLAIPAMLKSIGKIYMWGCTLGVSMAVIYAYVQWLIGE